MADIVSADVRSRMMSGIRGRNTKPELLLRKGLHRLGFRFRLHAPELPGKPDIVFPRYNAVLLAHGCFWHGHDCHLFKLPSTRQEFWQMKIERNRLVDARTMSALADLGWRVGVVWECALKGRTRLPFDDVLRTCADWLCNEAAGLEIAGE
ncbi:very short patch repair endonuclease [Aurantiacibacter spongiae]|uniref:Very short patch repair endonuclease n=1 Tax=Aurantiacibacter spongiae TaxID=2488860 RepID=A0A3N5CU74_9SPHN|nr:very short patch repair endonuclease [Aurantiacibacter spongiae]RPF70970.1 DNA mismatch endonuclease Vsr [Aurantiacibacter spongiae]